MAAIIQSRILGRCLAVFLALQLASCGTLLYPERRGQPPGRLDVGVVALDAVGLLIFFIPGVVAFAVDFATGTIYLPPERPYYLVPVAQSWQTVHVDPSELTPQRLEAIVGAQAGQEVRLEPGTYRALRVGQIQECTPSTLETLRDAAARVVFRGSGE